MTIESMYGWLILAAFAFFIVTLGSVSEQTEASLKARDKGNRQS